MWKKKPHKEKKTEKIVEFGVYIYIYIYVNSVLMG